MANTATITKESVTQSGTNYNINLKVVINDGAADILDFTVSVKYNPNMPDMSGIMSILQGKIKEKWDDYTDNKNIFDAAVLTNGITTLQNQANTYINQ